MNPANRSPRLPWELIEKILVDVVTMNYPLMRDRVLFTPHQDDVSFEHDLRQYLYVARGLTRAHRAIVLRFPGCAVPCAVADGRIDRLQLCAAIEPAIALYPEYLGAAFQQAVQRGDTAVLAWLFDRDAWALRSLMQRYTSVAVIQAAARNDVSFCQWWLRRTAPHTRGETSCAMAVAIDTAAKLGHVAILDWWMSQAFPVAKSTSRFVRVASAHGQINVLEWAVRAGFPVQQSTDAMDAASANGHIDVLEWWCNVQERGVIRKLPFQAPMTKAGANGHVDVLEWWWRRFGSVLSAKDREYAVVVTSRNAQLDALNWWLEDKKRWSGSSVSVMVLALKRALQDNHVPVLDRWKQLVIDSHAGVDQAKSLSSVPPLSWWADCGCTIGLDIADFTNASRNGAVDAMQWWIAHKLPFVHSPKAIDCACHAGHVAVLDWWLHSSGLEPLYTVAALGSASRQGHDHVLEWWERSGLPLKYTEETRREGIVWGWTRVASWWERPELPPSAPLEGECLPRIVNAFESTVGREGAE
ncbi:hypothetical protein AMAG_08529 [Allomyces macrogynus ATCC 38327]|uniref:Uncharacterized protein n=1 Tax=Allomyces macrogynus (strain ATCC 38327) TaxID=578462 RepID=A0A0L0SLG8_ALLM3|nr:hypothetical protein AMAG_08529 [Allomyces macrogynus ATCC 38327]|eukprot:KNE63396.1 hypothetical protein AMAG_08529 [Allomyces macrogynus ATCC 38327]